MKIIIETHAPKKKEASITAKKEIAGNEIEEEMLIIEMKKRIRNIEIRSMIIEIMLSNQTAMNES